MFFLKPFKVIFFVYLLGVISLASDIAQLTNFNILNYIQKHSPISCYLVILGTIVLYIGLLIIEIYRNQSKSLDSTTEQKVDQIIRTGNVKNSTIIQIKRDKEGN
jgi:hypothetical protein